MAERSQHEEPVAGDTGDWDAALARLEDVLLGTPFDRALPNLDELMEQAKVTLDFLRGDERAFKLLREAIIARPLSSGDEIQRAKSHVEMMTLEVEVLTERLRDTDIDEGAVARTTARLHEIRGQLAKVRDQL